jgi:hypothetical protein
MPFEAYSAHFRPDELDILAAAYEAAWQDLWTERLTLGAEQTSVLKKNLAQIILASACNGKRDVTQLKEVALRGVSSRARALL